MTNDDLIQKRTDEKYKRINEYRSETQLSIQLGQALNLAVEVMLDTSCNDRKTELWNKELDSWVDFFMSYLDKKRKQVFDQNEKDYAANPAPTVETYENMTEVQKKFLKDKQLEANRKKYQENKAKGFIKRKNCPDCGNYVAIDA